jgi:lipoyl(octanoyl) transferase
MRQIVRYQWIEKLTYQEVWDFQSNIHQALIADKKANKDDNNYKPDHRLILCEHNPVFTLGKSGIIDHLLLNEDQLNSGHIEFFKINRGGDITYHGPGQITGYPILDLDWFYNDIHRYVREIEECIILTINEFGLEGSRLPEYTGVWIAPDSKSPKYRKICAIGVHLSRWVSLHGFALNVNTELAYFHYIVPCGIADSDKSVTSIAEELGHEVEIDAVCLVFKKYFEQIFSCKIEDYERKISE